MKKIIFTQRVEIVESYGERRDCADQNIACFLEACGYIPVPVPNVLKDMDAFLKAIQPEGILLTGGNSLQKWGGNAAERDRTDYELIRLAIQNKIPLYGFCRGMQSILDYFGCELSQVQGHVAVRHEVWEQQADTRFLTNSFHNQACFRENLKVPLYAAACTEDGVVEWVRHESLPIEATMWHPEREVPFAETDLERVKKLFQ